MCFCVAFCCLVRSAQEWVADASFASVEIQEGKHYSDEHYESQGFVWQTEFDLRAKFGNSEEAWVGGKKIKRTRPPANAAKLGWK